MRALIAGSQARPLAQNDLLPSVVVRTIQARATGMRAHAVIAAGRRQAGGLLPTTRSSTSSATAAIANTHRPIPPAANQLYKGSQMAAVRRLSEPRPLE